MLTTFIGLVLVYMAYLYLRNLSNCSCVNQIYVGRMKYVESILLVVTSISIILGVITNVFMVDVIEIVKRNLGFAALITGFYAIVMLVVYMYFVYDTYKFSSTMKVPCNCADGWQKYYIYFQSLMMVMIIFGSASAILLTVTNPNAILSTIKSVSRMSQSSSTRRRRSSRRRGSRRR